MNRFGQGVLQLLRRGLLDSRRDLGRARGVGDVSLVLVGIGVVDLPSDQD